VRKLDPEKPEYFEGLDNGFDTVLCLNVLEYAEDPSALLKSLASTLRPNGVLIVLAPHAQRLFGTLDRSLGHKRRYDAAELRALLDSHGFAVEKAYTFNKAGAPPWWAYSKLFGSKNISKPVLKLFDKTVWLWRRFDGLMPWPGLTLIAVARRRGVAEPIAEEPRKAALKAAQSA
jgi:SAM-dependent methyltransferase